MNILFTFVMFLLMFPPVKETIGMGLIKISGIVLSVLLLFMITILYSTVRNMEKKVKNGDYGLVLSENARRIVLIPLALALFDSIIKFAGNTMELLPLIVSCWLYVIVGSVGSFICIYFIQLYLEEGLYEETEKGGVMLFRVATIGYSLIFMSLFMSTLYGLTSLLFIERFVLINVFAFITSSVIPILYIYQWERSTKNPQDLSVLTSKQFLLHFRKTLDNMTHSRDPIVYSFLVNSHFRVDYLIQEFTPEDCGVDDRLENYKYIKSLLNRYFPERDLSRGIFRTEVFRGHIKQMSETIGIYVNSTWV